jgi:sialate O-acetylesterase
MNRTRLLFLLGAALLVTPATRANVTPAALFCDHAVLQQGAPIPVWGTADEGEKVTVEIAGQKATTVANRGRWQVRIPALTAGGPYTLTIRGNNRVVLNDVLIGEVWVCSGQSNMERQLGLREGQKPIIHWEQEAASANFPEIRHFGVAQKYSLTPVADVQGRWAVCTPETAPDFTAVGFFFGRALYQARKVPIGLIHSSWGGTPAEAWTSADALARRPDFAADIALLRKATTNTVALETAYEQELARWYAANDAGSSNAAPWSAEQFDVVAWQTMVLPTLWEKAGLPDFDGVVWFRREVEVPADWVGKPVALHLGAVDDGDTTWVNGRRVGATNKWDKVRVYELPASLLKAGKNSIAVRVLDTGGGGGLYGGGDALRLVRTDEPSAEISLNGEWRYRVASDFSHATPPPINLLDNPSAPTALYNAMIAPLQPYAMRGVIWYQGEANSPRARQYRTLFPDMVADWRRQWGEEFPFLYVQIAPFKEMLPEIREAQLLALGKIKRSAMVVTLDVGDAEDIHPADKRPVGERLALAARAIAYGEKLEYSGPLYESITVKGHEAVVKFSHEGSGLAAPAGELHGFTIAGVDKVFRPAKAVIVGDTVVLSSDEVSNPVAVRYAWANAPTGDLYNREGLPASPFRTDVD